MRRPTIEGIVPRETIHYYSVPDYQAEDLLLRAGYDIAEKAIACASPAARVMFVRDLTELNKALVDLGRDYDICDFVTIDHDRVAVTNFAGNLPSIVYPKLLPRDKYTEFAEARLLAATCPAEEAEAIMADALDAFNAA